MTTGPVTVTLNQQSRRYLDYLKQQLGPARLYPALVKVLDRRAKFTAGRVVREGLSGGKGLARRTKALSQSIEGRGEMLDGVPALRVGVFRGTALKYVGPQELGTKGFNSDSPFDTITPKKGTYLAIPTGDALTPAGVSRYGGPRAYETATGRELVFIKFKKRNKADAGFFDFGPRGPFKKNGQVDFKRAKLVYVLAKKVDIQPHFFIRNGILNDLDAIAADVGKYLDRALARAV